MKRISKKAMVDDLFDYIITVFAAIFILMFLGVVINGGIVERQEYVKDHLEKNQQTADFLVGERLFVEKGFYSMFLEQRYQDIKKYGIVDKEKLYADDIYVAGTDADGDPIPIPG